MPKGDALDFTTHPFLAEPYRDTHRELVFLKGAQLGFSTLSIVRTLWAVTRFPIAAIYTFPTTDDVSRFTAARINPIVLSSSFLTDRILNVNSVRMKQFALQPVASNPHGATSTIYFNGAQNEKDATTADADLLIHDEEDKSNPQIIEQYESRLDHSKYKWKIRLSTPSMPGAGIDRAFRASDQRQWLLRCPSCNHDFEMKFPDCITPDSIEEVEAGTPAHYVCPRCRRPLPEEARASGRWVAMAPGPDKSHGYAISQMAAPWITAERILYRRAKATWEQDFWNLVMGIPWIDSTEAMTREAILSRQDPMRSMESTGSGTYIGIDVGKMIDVVVDTVEDGIPRTIHMGRYADWNDLDLVVRRFGAACVVIDAFPEEHAAREFQKRFPGVVWRCSYLTNPTAPREWKWDQEIGLVKVPRTEVLTQSAKELLTLQILPRFDGSPAWEAFIRHHEASQKVPVFIEGIEESRIVERYQWIERGPDHMFHARTYAMIARKSPFIQPSLPKIGIRSFRRGGSKLERDLTALQAPPIDRRR